MSAHLSRLADAIATLAASVAQAEVRAQLHALSGLVRNLDATGPASDTRSALEEAIRLAIANGDERGALDGARHLARLDRAPLHPVDWSAASGD